MATELSALRWLFYRAACLIRDGAPITYETAVAKVLADETGQKLARLGMDLLGVWGSLRPGSREARLDGEISHAYLTSLGHTIAGGTAEILRTTVATRGLGLPATQLTVMDRQGSGNTIDGHGPSRFKGG
jgi:alkylation response protein AidB-like acyl-CoA dehydrogenase